MILNKIFQTAAVNEAIAENLKFAAFTFTCIREFKQGNWGQLCQEDANLNNLSLKDGSRILASYELPEGLEVCDGYGSKVEKLWVIAP